MFGVVWSSKDSELAQTGYRFETMEAARAVGERGCEWFALPYCPSELGEYVGVKVDWTSKGDERPLGFYVDADHDDSAIWHDAPAVTQCD